MTRPLLPPKYVNTLAFVVYHPKLSDGAKVFYSQIRGLAWKKNYEATDWIAMKELELLTGKKHTAIYGYMRSLELIGALLWRTSGDASFIYTFPDPSISANTESLIHSTTTDISLEGNVIIEDSPQFRKSGKVEGEVPVPGASIFPADAAAQFGDNSIRDAATLYTMITNQITFPPMWSEQYRQALADILYNNFERDVDKAAASGRPVFRRYCGTRGKNQRPYSPTGTGWLDWWLAELAPKPENGNADPAEQERLAKKRAEVAAMFAQEASV